MDRTKYLSEVHSTMCRSPFACVRVRSGNRCGTKNKENSVVPLVFDILPPATSGLGLLLHCGIAVLPVFSMISLLSEKWITVFGVFNLRQLFLHFNQNMKFYRKIRKQIQPDRLAETVKENKRATVVVIAAFMLFLYVLFNSNGIIARVRLEMQKSEALEKIRSAEEEQKKLKEQSKALDGDPKAVEKVAREKYGMVRENEKVYKVSPKK